jgi:hypothetical protein
MGRYLMGYIGEQSKPYGTEVRYVDAENIGLVELGCTPGPGQTSPALD